MVAWLLLMMQESGSLIETARAKLSVEHRCERDENSADITVCARRRADRYRVPLVVHTPGDPMWEGVPAERERLLHRPNPVQELSPFLVGGGMAGVHATVDGSGTHAAPLRPLAP